MLEGTTAVSRIEFPMDFAPGHVAAYVLEGEEVILFDTGPSPTSTSQSVSVVDQYDRTLDSIDHIFLTHPHPDHAGRLKELAEASDADVYAPLSARDRLSRPLENVSGRIRETIKDSGFEELMQERLVDTEIRSQERMRTYVPFDVVDHWIVDDQRISIGDRTIDVIRTPGHHVDHHCYATTVEEQSVLFSGDMAIKPFRAILINNRLDYEYHSAVASYKRSLDRLEACSLDRVFPGHGPVHDDPSSSFEEDRASVERRIEGVAGVLSDQPKTAAEVTESLLDEDTIRKFFPEILSSLTYLVNRGRASRERKDDIVYYSQ